MSRLALVFAATFLFVCGFFVAQIPTQPIVADAAQQVGMEAFSAVFVLLLALPSYIAVMRWLGWRRGVLVLAVLGVFAIGIETLAVYTGFPYGQFAHGEKIGAKLFGAVPWTVPFAWTPLVLAALTLASQILASQILNLQIFAPQNIASRSLFLRIRVLCLGALLLVAIDLLLDPAAVAQAFWEYRHPSAYYDVPLSNFLGWLISGFIGCALLAKLSRWDMSAPLPIGLITSGFLILVFWSSVALWMSLVFPALIGVGLTILAGYFVLRPEPETGREV